MIHLEREMEEDERDEHPPDERDTQNVPPMPLLMLFVLHTTTEETAYLKALLKQTTENRTTHR